MHSAQISSSIAQANDSASQASGTYRDLHAEVSAASWRKSSWSSYNGSCVEVAELPGNLVCMRDTKQHGTGPVLAFTNSAWRLFISRIRNGELDF